MRRMQSRAGIRVRGPRCQRAFACEQPMSSREAVRDEVACSGCGCVANAMFCSLRSVE